MKIGDKQVAKPEIDYTETKATIEALTDVRVGARATATDTGESGHYTTGSYWHWEDTHKVVTVSSDYQVGKYVRNIFVTGTCTIILPSSPNLYEEHEIIAETSCRISGSNATIDGDVLVQMYQGEAFHLQYVKQGVWRLL